MDESTLPATTPAPVSTRQRMLTLPEKPEDALYLGEMLLRSRLLPDHIRTPEQACYLILAGAEMGMPATRALRSLMIVKGKVIEGADSQLARFKECGGRAQFAALDDTRAELRLRHPNGDEHVETYTIEDAKRAGLLTNVNWQKHPRAMLRSRAITAGLKSIGWIDAVGAYDPDEAREFAGPSSALDDAPAPERIERQDKQPEKRPGRKSTPKPEVVVEAPAAEVVVEQGQSQVAEIQASVDGVFRRANSDRYLIAIGGVRYETGEIEHARTAKQAQMDGEEVVVELDGSTITSLRRVA